MLALVLGRWVLHRTYVLWFTHILLSNVTIVALLVNCGRIVFGARMRSYALLERMFCGVLILIYILVHSSTRLLLSFVPISVHATCRFAHILAASCSTFRAASPIDVPHTGRNIVNSRVSFHALVCSFVSGPHVLSS